MKVAAWSSSADCTACFFGYSDCLQHQVCVWVGWGDNVL